MEQFLDYVPWLAVIVFGFLLLPYVLGPLVIRFSLRQSAEPVIDIIESDHPRLPRAVKRHFSETAEALGSVGFEVVQALALPEQTPRVRAFVLMFVNRPEKDAAIATAMYVDTAEGKRLQAAYVEIVAHFQDDTLIQTNNSPELGAFPPRSGQVTTQLPMVQDATQRQLPSGGFFFPKF